LPDLSAIVRMLVRLSLAALMGGLLGYERSRSGKSAGLRTHMLVAVGAALFVLIPQSAGMPLADMSRVIQGIVAGIGFIGGGTILKQSEKQQVHGLTTAAGLWLTAALGIAAGMGREASAILGTVLAFFILYVLGHLERYAELSDNHGGK
jgi:putative Mg2+ transporter-C (MgtC) family protein